MNDPRKVDIYSAAHKRDPFPLYTFLRSEAPVFEVRVPVLKRAWLITRYDDVVLCLQDSDRFVKNPRNAGLKLVQVYAVVDTSEPQDALGEHAGPGRPHT